MFSKNRERLLEAEIAARFLTSILDQGEIRKLLSDEHFSVDGTRVEAWASLKSFKPKRGKDGDEPPASSGRNEEVDFRGEKRTQSRPTLRPPIRTLGSIASGSGMEAKLSFIGHALMENGRNGLFVAARLTNVSGHAARDWPRSIWHRALCRQSHSDHSWAATRASMPLTSSWSFAKST